MLSMMLSLVVVPAAAEGVPTITLSTVSFSESGAFAESSPINEAKAGDLIAVKVYFKNQSSQEFYIKSLDMTLEYDAAVFEPYSYSYRDGRNTVSVGPAAVTDLNNFMVASNKLTNKNAVKFSAASADGIAIDSVNGEYNDAVLCY